jgi:hypothetical protein
MIELSSVTRQPGFLRRGEHVARDEGMSCRARSDIPREHTHAIMKAYVFMEGNYNRAITGATDDPYLKSFGDGVVELAERAEAMALGG